MKPLFRILMLLFNYVPFFLICSIIFTVWEFHEHIKLMLLIIICIIYVIPPLITRIALLIYPLKQTEYELFSTGYYVWWLTFCCQIIYLRFPFLEEMIRCFPGLYSMWLRLFWGAKIGRFTYWAPGTKILDRPFLNIGNNVIFAADVRLNPHAQLNGKLVLAPITIEDNVVVGAYSLLVSGTVLKANQETKPFLKSSPFTIWDNGAKVKNDY